MVFSLIEGCTFTFFSCEECEGWHRGEGGEESEEGDSE